MNQPTWEEFEALKEEHRQEFREEQRQLKEEVRKLREQITEPITIPRIELDPGGIQSRLDNHAEILRDISKKYDERDQQLTLIYTDVGYMKADIGVLKGSVNTLKTDMEGVKVDIKSIKATQSDHGERFKEHGERLIRIEARLETMPTRDDINQINSTLAEILNRLPPKQ